MFRAPRCSSFRSRDPRGAITFDVARSTAPRLLIPIRPMSETIPELNGFDFIGKGLTPAEFTRYVDAYDFGTIPPDYVVLHHSGSPCTRAAPEPGAWVWDAGEAGKTQSEIYAQRKARLINIASYYKGEGWKRGPHLFIDERYIWLFSPMREPGTHAKEGGNEFRDAQGRLHYSIGIEVVGCYTHVRWPEPVERNVGHAVAALKRRLGTFELEYRADAPKHTAKGRVGSICSHRDFNKPSCPGDAITENYYISVLQREWQRFSAGGPTPPAGRPLTAASPVVGAATGTRESVERYLQRHLPPGSEYAGDVGTIVGHYWTYAHGVGVDPFLAATQMVLETNSLAAPWAARPRRNPASLGVAQEGGLSFGTWEVGVQAHLGQLLALALRDDQASPEQRDMMRRNPRHASIDPALRGTAFNVETLGAGWGGGDEYGRRILALARELG